MADFRPPPGKWRNGEKFFLLFKKVTVADFSALPAIIRKCTQKEEGFPQPARMCPAMPSDDEDALRLQRQIRRAVAETCGPARIRELPAQDETAAYVQLLPCDQQFLEARTFFSKTTQRTDIRKMSVRCIGMLWSQPAVKPSVSLYTVCLVRCVTSHNHS